MKKVGIFFTLLLLHSYSVFSSNERLLIKGDSLFDKQKYMEALKVYDSLYTQKAVFSPSMLLKMAYIYEGKGDVFNALYYLNVYNLYFPNVKVVRKMEDLASKNNLKGFNYSDWEYFVGLYNEYYNKIEWFLVTLCFLFFAYLSFRFFKDRYFNLARTNLLIFLVVITLAVVNIGLPSYKAIIIAENALGMDGPSSASVVVKKIPQGNQVNILNKEGVWYEVLFDNDRFYIREDHLFLVSNKRVQEQFRIFGPVYNSIKNGWEFVFGN